MRDHKHIIFPALAGLVLGVAWVGFANRQALRDDYALWKRGPVPAAMTRQQAEASAVQAPSPSAEPAPTKPPASKTGDSATRPAVTDAPLPSQMNLKVPFVPQAPFKIWDATHEDTCEEASMTSVQAYLDGETSVSAADAEKRILAIVDYETKTYGDYKSTDAARTAEIMTKFLGIDGVKVLPFSTADDIKREVAAARPVILPTSGKDLKNPNFKNGGPLYHMLVVKGYANGKFITDDPGTRLGEDYVYDEATLMAAAHDWNGGDVEHGAKMMIVVEQ